MMKALSFLLVVACFCTRADVLYSNDIDLAGDDSGKHFHYFDDQLVMQSYHRYLYWHDTEDQGQLYIDDFTTEAYVSNQGKEVRISMLYGAENSFSIDYQTKDYLNQISVFDEQGQLLTQQNFSAAAAYSVPSADCDGVPGCAYQSTFNDGRLNVEYEGVAAYVEFDINTDNEAISNYEAFLLDNFHYTPASATPLTGLLGLHMTTPALPTSVAGAYQFEISSLLTSDWLPLFLQIPLMTDFDVHVQGPDAMSLALLTPFPYWEEYIDFDDSEGIYGSPTITSQGQSSLIAQQEWWDFYEGAPAVTGLAGIREVIPMTDEVDNLPLLLMVGTSTPGDYLVTVIPYSAVSSPASYWLLMITVCLLLLRHRRSCV